MLPDPSAHKRPARARHPLMGSIAPPCMATVQQGFDVGATLLKLYKDLPYVRKLGYSIGEMAGRILLRVIIDYTNDDEFFDNSME